MPTAKTDIIIPQGTDWSRGWAVTVNGAPIDDTWTIRSQIRRKPRSTRILHTLAASVVGGNAVIAVAPEDSIPWTWRCGVYDVEIVNADESLTLRVAQGSVTVDPEVTR